MAQRLDTFLGEQNTPDLDIIADNSSTTEDINTPIEVFTDAEKIALKKKGPIGWWEAAGRQRTGDLVPYGAGALIGMESSFIEDGKTMMAIKRLKEDNYGGEEAKRRDQENIRDYLRREQEAQIRGFTYKAKVYQGLSQMPAFILEFASSGGIIKAGKAVLTKGGKKIVKKGIKKYASKAIGAAGMATGRSVFMHNRYRAKYAERQIFANLAITDKGEAVLKDSTESPYKSFTYAFADIIVENLSEEMGSSLTKMAKGTGKIAGEMVSKLIPQKVKTTAGKAFVNKLGKALIKAYKKTTPGAKMKNIMAKGGFHGMLEEMGEERVGDVLRAVLGISEAPGEDTDIFNRLMQAIPDREQLLVEAGIFSVPGAVSLATSKAFKRLTNYDPNLDIKKINENLSETEKQMLADELKKDVTEEGINNFEKGMQRQIEKEETPEERETRKQLEYKEAEKEVKEKRMVGELYTEEELKETQDMEKELESGEMSTQEEDISQEVAEKVIDNNREKVSDEETISEEDNVELQEEVSDSQKILEDLEDKVQGYLERGEEIPESLLKRREAIFDILGLPQDLVKRKKSISVSKLLGKFNKKVTVSEAAMLRKLLRAEQKASREGYKEGRKQQKEIQDELTQKLKEQNTEQKKKHGEKTQELKDANKKQKQQQKERTHFLDTIRKRIEDFVKAQLPGHLRKDFLKAVRSTTTIAQMKKVFERIRNARDKDQDRVLRRAAEKTILKKIARPENKILVDFQVKIEKILEKLGDKVSKRVKALHQMTTQDLVDLAEEVAGLRAEGIQQFKMRKEKIENAAMLMRAALIKSAGGLNLLGGLAQGSKEERDILKRNALQKADLWLMRPTRFLKKILGDLGVRYFGQSIDLADTNEAIKVMRRLARIGAAKKQFNVTDFLLGKIISVELPGAGKHSYNVNQILRMYVAKGDKSSYDALIHGNFAQVKDAVKIVDALIDSVRKEYPGYLEYADAVQEIVAEAYQDVVNTMANAYNMSMAKVKKYFPIYRNYTGAEPEYMSQPWSSFVLEDSARTEKPNYTAIERDHTITRQQIADHNQMPMSLDFMGDALKIIREQEHFINFAALSRSFNTIKSNTNLKRAVEANHGKEAWSLFEDYLNKVINPKLMYQNSWKYGRMTRAAISTSYLAGNMVTALKQLPSIWLAKRDSSMFDIIVAVCEVLRSSNRAEIYGMDPSLEVRAFSRAYEEMVNSPEKFSDKDLLRRLQIAKRQVGVKAFNLILNMDKFAVLTVYRAVYRNQVRKVGEAKAREIAHKAVLETQPQARVKDLAAIYRTNNEFFKMTLMFTNQLNQIYNMMSEDVSNDWHEGNKMRAMETLTSIAISSLFIFMMANGRPPKDKKEWFEAITGNFINAVPFAGSLALTALRGYNYGMSPITGVMNNLRYSAENIYKGDAGVEDYIRLMTSLAIIGGQSVPGASQIMRTGSGVVDLMRGNTKDLRRLVWSKKSLESKNMEYVL